MDLGNPHLDRTKLAEGMGAEAAKTATLEGCGDLMRQSFATDGPFVIAAET